MMLSDRTFDIRVRTTTVKLVVAYHYGAATRVAIRDVPCLLLRALGAGATSLSLHIA